MADTPLSEGAAPNKSLSPEALRALEEAAARRKLNGEAAPTAIGEASGEIGGPAGPEPTRYGDWERKGIISDF